MASVSSIYDMEPNFLKVNEIDYELRIRGVARTDRVDVDTKRKNLRRRLREDQARPNIVYTTSQFVFQDEKKEVDATIAEIRELLRQFDGSRVEANRRLQTRINHVLGRVSRFCADPASVEGEESAAYKLDNTLIIVAFDETRLEILDQANLPGGSGSADVQGAMHKIAPVYKWGITFDGKSVSSFLQRIDELRRARSTSKEELFRSAVDLFQGQALIWYRSIRDSVHSWDSLVQALKRDFLPPDYDEELWREIRSRTQGYSERVTIYIAAMANLFSRLSQPPSEEIRLSTIKKNLLPKFQTRIALQEIRSIEQLADVCRTLEAAFTTQQRFQPPPRRSVALLEPDLAYSETLVETEAHSSKSRQSRSHCARPEVSELRCYNCNRAGHLKRDCREAKKEPVCFGCGRRGVIRPNCPKCSKN